ncbi:MAG: hypothetical protein LUC18_02180, partial [Porphyromonadaceae bacterium]|nr:hypothetical protein [Porphyromonadaceae bacterium]
LLQEDGRFRLSVSCRKRSFEMRGYVVGKMRKGKDFPCFLQGGNRMEFSRILRKEEFMLLYFRQIYKLPGMA